MTHQEVIHLISSFTEREIEARENYYLINNENHVVPPLPPDAEILPMELTPNGLYHKDRGVIPYWHERYLQNTYHDHNHIELMYQVSGCCTNTIEASSTILNRGDICLLPPGVYHLPEVNDDNSVMLNLLISTSTISDIFQNFLFDHDHALSNFFKDVLYGNSHPKYYYCRGFNEKIHYLICEILIEYIENPLFSELVIKNYLTNIICELYRIEPQKTEISQQSTSSTKTILPILQYIYNNYKTVTLEELSERFSYSQQYLCRMFQLHTKKSFTQYLLELRISRVKNLLINTDLKIERIAELCGFDCVPYFHRKFKSTMGCTPDQFRKSKRI